MKGSDREGTSISAEEMGEPGDRFPFGRRRGDVDERPSKVHKLTSFFRTLRMDKLKLPRATVLVGGNSSDGKHIY